MSMALLAFSCVQMGAVDARAACDASVKASTPTSDFEFRAQGAIVLHKKTGLEWQRCPEGMKLVAQPGAADHSRDTCDGEASLFTFDGAKQVQAKANAGAGRDGATDWRLPTMDELASIVEDACQIPAINPSVFPNTPVTWFWAISPKQLSAGYAWGIGFGFGGYYVGRHDNGAVRLVRGSHP
jgi:hypothetical protein